VKRDKLVQVIVNFEIEIRPVVKASAPQVFIIRRKGKRPDQVQATLGSSNKSSDVPGVLRDFGAVKADVEVTLIHR
jgi:hypothetical protein